MKNYIYGIIAIALIVGVGKSVYDQVNKKGAKAQRLECHKDSTVFEKVNNNELLKLLQEDLKQGNVTVSIQSEEAKYMESKLFEYVDENAVKQEFINYAKLQNTDLNNRSSINILIYENDKEDPGKKTPKSKLYAGYLVVSAKVDNKLAYKLQIDFFDHQGKDISKLLQCVVESIQTIEIKKGKE
jgi:hypothetical protein